jgi:hypothetical protein
VVAGTSETQPYPLKIAASHKAATKISILRVRHASIEITLGEA